MSSSIPNTKPHYAHPRLALAPAMTDNPFFLYRPDTPGTLGKAKLKERNFVLPNEKVQDHGQLPQFMPRTWWPSERDAEESQARPALNLAIDWLDPAAVHLLHDDATKTYPRLEPMPPYKDDVYDGCQWKTQLAIAHNLFHKTLQNGNHVSAMEMTVLVRIVTYGMFDSTTFFAPFVVDGAGDVLKSHLDPNQAGKPRELRRHTRAGEPPKDSFNQRDLDWSRTRMRARRWVVVPVLHECRQWNMTIFDREQGQLYIFDCGDDEARLQRFKSAIRVWVLLLDILGQRHSFLFFVPRVTRQGEMESGPVCVAWLMEALRNQVGGQMTSRDDKVVMAEISDGNLSLCRQSGAQDGDHYTSSLHLRDWVPKVPEGERSLKPKAQLIAVRRIIRVMVANELGLRNHPVMKQRYNKVGGRGDDRPSSAITLLKEAARYALNTGDVMEEEKYFTGQGGQQFALPTGRLVLPYDAEAPRRHKMPRTSATPAIDMAKDGLRGPPRTSVEFFRSSDVPEMRITRRKSRLYKRRALAAPGNDNGFNIW
ncbi:uncharacterized protein G6M90_00g032780 [Metarhizium brunneum]|uniref:Uncharacterized protein n=1 Tax=Metarhizium brunneum TaxID=500148 RepID=A0A7D5YT57_9HYPO|nr:hypothetical protein G6M90_00g032780 [Metarhizium brunneum]